MNRIAGRGHLSGHATLHGSRRRELQMRYLSGVSVMLGAVVFASGALAVVSVGCGGDDTSLGGDAQSDATTSSPPDGTTPVDGHTDAKEDAKKDAKGVDANEDAAHVKDGGSGEEASSGDAAALRAFPSAVNTAYCKRLAACCDGADAAAFDLGSCVSGLASF